jgi:hypothetical protein
MPNQLSPEEKKARRAEINRQNAKKSTGPKTDAGKATSRFNGLKHGARTVIIDLSGSPGVSVLSCDDANEYREMVAEYNRAIAPNGRAEVTIVQRIIDAQWRLLRNSRLQTLEFEASLVEVRHTDDHELLGENAADIDMISANRGVIDTKYTKRLQQEEVMLLRIINMSYRELNQLRKLNPQPPPPVRRRIEYINEPSEPVHETRETNSPEVVEKKPKASPQASDRSQPQPAFFPMFKRPAKPKTFAAGAGLTTEANPAQGFPVNPW